MITLRHHYLLTIQIQVILKYDSTFTLSGPRFHKWFGKWIVSNNCIVYTQNAVYPFMRLVQLNEDSQNVYWSIGKETVYPLYVWNRPYDLAVSLEQQWSPLYTFTIHSFHLINKMTIVFEQFSFSLNSWRHWLLSHLQLSIIDLSINLDCVCYITILRI